MFQAAFERSETATDLLATQFACNGSGPSCRVCFVGAFPGSIARCFSVFGRVTNGTGSLRRDAMCLFTRLTWKLDACCGTSISQNTFAKHVKQVCVVRPCSNNRAYTWRYEYRDTPLFTLVYFNFMLSLLGNCK